MGGFDWFVEYVIDSKSVVCDKSSVARFSIISYEIHDQILAVTIR